MILENVFNADTLWWIYFAIGYCIMTVILKILKAIVKLTKNKLDDKIVNTLCKWHKINKERLKK